MSENMNKENVIENISENIITDIIENVNESFQFLAYIVNVMNPGKIFVKGNSQI